MRSPELHRLRYMASSLRDLHDDPNGTKGEKVKIGPADRTPRETLEQRLEKTPSNARCFAQGSSLMC